MLSERTFAPWASAKSKRIAPFPESHRLTTMEVIFRIRHVKIFVG
jgi:hypothetical protein